MSSAKQVLDPAFQGAGQKPGTEIWRIEDFKPVPLPKSDYGKFYCGDSYIVLQTTCNRGGAYLFDIHFWIGKDSSQDEAGTSAIKTVELDSMLGGRAVQHREPQGYESDKFISYFKPCIIPMEGGFASGFRKPEEEKFETRLYICKGKRAIRVKEVPFARSSLNHDDVFILDTEKKIYQFNGANSNIQERAKALEVIQHLKDKYHEGVCDVAIVDDGKLQAESDSGEFWVVFGGFAPIGKKAPCDDDVILETTPTKLYSVNNGKLTLEDTVLTKSILENTKCFLLDCGSELYVWVGRVTQVDDRKAASVAVEEFIVKQNRPKTTRVTQVIQGYEDHTFKSKFDSWPVSNAAGASAEDGRGKVAAMLKKKGDVKGASKNSPTVNEEVPPLLEVGGKLEVWCVDGSAKTALPKEDLGKFHSGDCYIVLYTYHSGDKREEFYLTCWIGKNSILEDQHMALQITNTIWNSMKARPVLGRIYQGKEPPQFIALFQPMVILKGGISCGYKNSVQEKGLPDETYPGTGVALVRIDGTPIHNNKTLQVDAVSTSLSSTNCFVLQSGNSVFIWIGNTSSYEQQQWAAKVAEFLKPGVAVKHCKEGTESSSFWSALGGKQNYSNINATQDVVREPHLYTFSFRNGKLEVTEVYNFSQDDLLTEDVMVLDTHAEVFVWMGQCVDTKEKQMAFEIGEKYIEHALTFEGLAPDVPLYKVSEGNEPCFFRTYFSWDSTRSLIHGNSFQKKLSLLFGMRSESGPKGSGDGGPTQRASALAALSSAFNPSSQDKQSTDRPQSSGDGGPTQRASALAALSSSLNTSGSQSRPGQGSQRAAAVAALSNSVSSQSPRNDAEGEAAEFDMVDEAERTEPDVSREETANENGGETIFSYDRLISKSTDPVRGIDYKRRETYLSDTEFQTVFGMNKEEFYQQPRWKQELQKRKADLF
ncbi:villin-2-like [Hordeum vulgare]|uniref:HP domain-containing protein n=1 Tax=Hordeum vulgare subsp. vulgare TaxID=112509 RepID=A0A8I6XZK5_HORVV|nr:villin-2-like [Hordeum vulgare subsp. vulgare]KAE8782114.1 villin-2-like [Hordeum vulgare]